MEVLRRRAATVDRLLLQAVRTRDASAIDIDVDELAAVDPELLRWRASAAWHRVDSWAWLAIRDSRLASTPAGLDLAARYQYGVARHLRMLDDLAFIRTTLADARVPFAVFKGAMLAESVYPRPDLRAYNDLDVLVSPDRLRDAIAAMESSGCAFIDHNWRLLTDQGAGQIHLTTPLQTVVDLHWNLMNTPPVRASFPIPTCDLLDRVVQSDVRGVLVPVLEPIDMLMHLCLHACLAGANRLCWLKDIAQVVAAAPVDWGEVTGRAGLWRARVPIGVALERASRVLGMAVPRDVCRDLIPSPSWRALTRGVDRVFPPYRAHRGGSVNRIVARAARADGQSTWSQLARRSVAATLHGSPLRAERHAWETPDDDPRSAAYPAGSMADYLAYVERQAALSATPAARR